MKSSTTHPSNSDELFSVLSRCIGDIFYLRDLKPEIFKVKPAKIVLPEAFHLLISLLIYSLHSLGVFSLSRGENNRDTIIMEYHIIRHALLQ